MVNAILWFILSTIVVTILMIRLLRWPCTTNFYKLFSFVCPMVIAVTMLVTFVVIGLAVETTHETEHNDGLAGLIATCLQFCIMMHIAYKVNKSK